MDLRVGHSDRSLRGCRYLDSGQFVGAPLTGFTWEFKGETCGRAERDKQELCRDVAALANAGISLIGTMAARRRGGLAAERRGSQRVVRSSESRPESESSGWELGRPCQGIQIFVVESERTSEKSVELS